MPTLEPRRGIGDQREARGMTFRETVGTKPLKLSECPPGELLRITSLDHAAHQLVSEGRNAPGELEGRHGAAQLVSFSRREASAFDSDPHCLFLKQRHPKGLAEDLLKLRSRINDF